MYGNFDVLQAIVLAGGQLANIGAHGTRAARCGQAGWSHNMTLTTRLVDTVMTPM
jgi:alcohol dehydrogenase